jgi:hypothetical protein
MLDETEVVTIPGAQKVDYADPRGDLSEVNVAELHGCVVDITDMINEYGSDENRCADLLRAYVAKHLQPKQDLYIAVADELAQQGVISKANFRKLLEAGKDRK